MIKSMIAVIALVTVGVASAADYVPGEILVKYKSGFSRERTTMNAFYNSMGVESVQRFSGLLKSYEKLKFKPTTSVNAALFEAYKNPDVEYAQPNYILKIQPVGKQFEPKARPSFFEVLNDGWPSKPTPGPSPTKPVLSPPPAEVIPGVDDPQVTGMYGLKKIQAQDAWRDTKGSKSVVVAVIDTGTDYNHEDLSFNMWRNPNPTKGDTVGYDFVHNDGLPFDDNKHGTHTAGTVGGVGANGVGVSGVAQRVSIMALKFLSGEGSGTTADAIRAVDYATEHGAKIMSNSWGGGADPDNNALAEAIDRARAKDILFVAAAGNESNNNDKNPTYPAAFKNENMLTVAATDKDDKLANFSNYGIESVHMAAPGVKVLSSVPGNGYDAFSGTSMACPHVAGAAALVWAKNPTWNYKQVKKALMDSADKLESLEGKVLTAGRLNVLKALQVK